MTKPTQHDIALAALAEPEQVRIPQLVVDLMAANHRDYVAITNSLIKNLRHQLADRDAELAAIRLRVNDLFAGDYMPTESAILQAVFYPSKALRERLRESAVSDG